MSSKDSEEGQPLLAPVEGQEEVAAAARKSRVLIISFVLLVVSGLGNKIFQKLMTEPMQNYPYTLSQLITFIYIPVSFAYIWPMLIWGKEITPEQRSIPWYKWCIMGCLDGSSGIMASFAVNYIPSGVLIILLTQSSIPISMVISKFMLGAKYAWHHFLGAKVVIFGLLVVVVPRLLVGSITEGTHETKGTVLMWMGVLVLSCVPAVFSNVYKEKALGEADIDVVYLNGWVAVYQFLFGVAVCIPAAELIRLGWLLPTAYASDLDIKSMWPNFVDGLKCYAGHNSIKNDTMDLSDLFGNSSHTPQPDNCHTAPVLVTSYMAFNICYNIFIILVLKHGSANLLFLALTLMVPLGNAAFALPIKVKGLNQPIHSFDIIGLGFILMGLVLYRFMPLLRRLLGIPEPEAKPTAVQLPVRAYNRNTMEFIRITHSWVMEATLVAEPLLRRNDVQIRRSYFDRLGIAGRPPGSVNPV